MRTGTGFQNPGVTTVSRSGSWSWYPTLRLSAATDRRQGSESSWAAASEYTGTVVGSDQSGCLRVSELSHCTAWAATWNSHSLCQALPPIRVDQALAVDAHSDTKRHWLTRMKAGTATGTSFSVMYAVVSLYGLRHRLWTESLRGFDHVSSFTSGLLTTSVDLTGSVTKLCEFRTALASADDHIKLDWAGYE